MKYTTPTAYLATLCITIAVGSSTHMNFMEAFLFSAGLMLVLHNIMN